MSYNYLHNIKQNILNILHYENNKNNKIYNINIDFGLQYAISNTFMFSNTLSIVSNITITFNIISNVSIKWFYMDKSMLEQ